MAQICEICGKKPQIGHNVSHANNKTKKVWHPNLQNKKITVDGQTVRKKICTRCLRSGAVVKV